MLERYLAYMALPAQILASSKCAGRYKNKTVTRAAKAMGHLGGLVGGPARAAALSDEQRLDIATHAANIRWSIPCSPRCHYCNR